MLTPEIVAALVDGPAANYEALEVLTELPPGYLEQIRMSRLMMAWQMAAQGGDVPSLLALPECRKALVNLIQGRRTQMWIFCSKRKPVAEAKAIMSARIQRRADRRTAQAALVREPGRIAKMWIVKLKKLAVEMGQRYHQREARLYQSKRARVVYGKGGQEEYDPDAYSKSYRSKFGGARWRNAGARLDSETKPTCVILENFRGTEVARLPLPRSEA